MTINMLSSGLRLGLCLIALMPSATADGSPLMGQEVSNCIYSQHNGTITGYVMTCCNLTSSNLQRTIDSLPDKTTRLLLTTAALEDTEKTAIVNFGHLHQLEVLLLDTAGELAGVRLNLSRHALRNNKRLRVFKSRVPLTFNRDIFLGLNSMEELALSDTEKDWNFVPELISASFRNMSRLMALSLRRFSRYWSNSNHLAYFEADKIFPSIHNSSIKRLDLSQNGIHSLSPTFHRVFKNLEYIDLSYNLLSMPYDHGKLISKYLHLLVWIEFCLGIKTLNHFDISRQGRIFPPKNQFTQLDLLDIFKYDTKTGQNQPPTYQGTVIKTKEELSNHCGCNPQSGSSYMLCECGSTFGLKSVSLAGMSVFAPHIRWKPKGYIDVYLTNNEIDYVDISDNKQWHLTDINKIRFIGFDKLKYLNAQNNEVGMLNESFFTSMTSLKVLLLAGNNLKESINENFTTLDLKQNNKLEVLDLSHNGLKYLPYDMFSSMGTLKYLNLSHNSLSNLNISMTSLHMLEIFNVSYNNLSELSKEVQCQLDVLVERNETKHLSLDFTGNPLLCGCNNLQFLGWFKSTHVNFTNRDNYICAHPFEGRMTIKDVKVDKLHSSCFPSITKTAVISVVLTFITIMTIVITTTVYCKRWRFRYWWYITQKGWRQLSNDMDPFDYDHDVFVAYNWQDSAWVHGPLLQEMEEKRGLNLCIHQRDFIPGEVLEELITEKIQKSRKTLLVLTPNFVTSNWCHFELHMARNQLFEKGQDVLVLVILKPIPSGSVNGTLYELLKKKLYLEWPEDAEGHDLFWNKLSDALAKDISQCRPFD